MILARLLVKSAFGEMAIVLAGVAIMEAFTEVGLRQNVIRNKSGAEPAFLNVIWWISALRCTSLCFLGYLAAPIIANFYDNPDSTILLRIGFLGILVNGYISPRSFLLEKNFRYKALLLLNQSAGVISVFAGIITAYYLRNVWALLIAYLTEVLLRSVISYIICPFLPRFSLDRPYLKEIIGFSKKMFGLPLLMMLFLQTDVFVIGKVLSSSALGMYVLVRALADIPQTLLTKIIQPILLPAFSTIQDEKYRLQTSLKFIFNVVFMLGLPTLSIVFLFSGDILTIVYGKSYVEVSFAFSLLCVYSLFFVFTSISAQSFYAIGRPDVHRNSSFIRTFIFLIIIYHSVLTLGLNGAASARVLVIISLTLMHAAYGRKLLGISLNEYLQCFWRGFRLSLIVILPVLLLKFGIHSNEVFVVFIGLSSYIIALIIGSRGILKTTRHNLLIINTNNCEPVADP